MIQSDKISSTQGISIRRLLSTPRTAGNIPRGITGNSLVELMMAVVILGMVFGSAFGVLSVGTGIIETSRDYTRVAQILQSEMEAMRTKNWTAITALTSGTFTPDPKFSAAFAARYTCGRVVTTPTGRPDQRQIVLSVSWKPSNGPRLTRFYVTRYTDGGLNDFYYNM